MAWGARSTGFWGRWPGSPDSLSRSVLTNRSQRRLPVAAEEVTNQPVGLLGMLVLRHVSAVIQDDGLTVGQCPADVVREAGGHQPVVSAPDEQRRPLQRRQPAPEAATAVRFPKVDLALPP